MQNCAKILDTVVEDVSGTALISLREFEKFLGPSVIKVWDRCRLARNKYGVALVSQKYLSEISPYKKMSGNTVRKGIDRLNKLGFVKKCGYKKYIIYGSLALVNNYPFISVPDFVIGLLKNNKAWGGNNKNKPLYYFWAEEKQKIFANELRYNFGQNIPKINKNVSTKIQKHDHSVRKIEVSVPKNRQVLHSVLVDPEKNKHQPYQIFKKLNEKPPKIHYLNICSVPLINLITIIDPALALKPSWNSFFKIKKNYAPHLVSRNSEVPLLVSRNSEEAGRRFFLILKTIQGEGDNKAIIFPKIKEHHMEEKTQRIELPSGAIWVKNLGGIKPEPNLDDKSYEKVVQEIAQFFDDSNDPARPYVYLRQRFLLVPGVPRVPTAAFIPNPMVKGPPLLNATTTPVERFRAIARTWTAAFNCRYGPFGKQTFIFTKVLKNPAKIFRSRYFKTIQQAAELFIEKEIPPAAWIMYSFDMWHEYYGQHDEDDPPPIFWVLGKKRILEKYGWFCGEAPSYFSGRKLFTSTHYEIIRLFNKMYAHMKTLPLDSTDAEIQAIAELYFPNGLYDRLVAKAIKKTERIQKTLDDLRDKGEWLWNDDWGIPKWLDAELDEQLKT
jgi:hypothetical protein